MVPYRENANDYRPKKHQQEHADDKRDMLTEAEHHLRWSIDKCEPGEANFSGDDSPFTKQVLLDMC